MNTIFAKILYEMEMRRDSMLVSIISERGSAPQKAGAQMLVGRGGRLCGTVGGGALEKAAEEMAVELLSQKRTATHEFRLHSEKEGGLDMLCGGDATLLFSFVASDDALWHDVAVAAIERIRALEGGFFAQSLDGAPALLDAQCAPIVGTAQLSEPSRVGGTLTETHFALPLPVGERAVIFGGGHCGAALTPILKSVGFRVTVFDDRAEYADRARFPAAEAVICGNYSRISDYLTLRADDYVVIMTTGHSFDLEVEAQVLEVMPVYVGAMGSRGKITAINKALTERGFSSEQLAHVHTPIGIPIGGATPEEIAVSIAAEMIAERAKNRKG